MQITFRRGKEVFELTVHGKYNFIVGESGTGKTYLSRLLSLYETEGEGSQSGAVELISYAKFTAERSIDSNYSGKAVYIDEFDMHHLSITTFYKTLQSSGCCFIICARDLPSVVAFGVEDIFKFEVRGRRRVAVPVYQELLKTTPPSLRDRMRVQCEDSKSGYMCLHSVYGEVILRGSGKDNLPKQVISVGGNVIVYCDLCGIGSTITALFYACTDVPNTHIYPTRSFERDALQSKRFPVLDLDSIEFWKLKVSEEEYYSALLNVAMKRVFGVGYSKGDKVCLSYLLSDTSWLPKFNSASGGVRKMNLGD